MMQRLKHDVDTRAACARNRQTRMKKEKRRQQAKDKRSNKPTNEATDKPSNKKKH
jgi:hypothetical protein